MKNKKIIVFLLFLFMFIPSLVFAEECDIDKITIKSISDATIIGNAEEKERAIVNGMNIKLNLIMTDVGDSVGYTFDVKNSSNDDYVIDGDIVNINSDYIDYLITSDDDSNVIKANSSKTMSLKVEYKNKVSNNLFENGAYNDNKIMRVNLSSDDTIDVPDTFNDSAYILVSIMIVLIVVTIYLTIINNRFAKLFLLIFAISIVAPLCVYALCKCDINIESTVEIKDNRKICVIAGLPGSDMYFFPFIDNVTWDEYYDLIDDNTRNELDDALSYHSIEIQQSFLTSKCMFVDGHTAYDCYVTYSHYFGGPYTDEDFQTDTFYGSRDLDDYILDSSKVCYAYID